MDWHAHIRAAFPAAVPDADVIDELAQHAAATYDAARADGCDEDEARRRVDEQMRALGRTTRRCFAGPCTRTPVSPPAADRAARRRSRARFSVRRSIASPSTRLFRGGDRDDGAWHCRGGDSRER